MGLDQLTNSLSLLNLVKGVASFAGPPLAGMYTYKKKINSQNTLLKHC